MKFKQIKNNVLYSYLEPIAVKLKDKIVITSKNLVKLLLGIVMM